MSSRTRTTAQHLLALLIGVAGGHEAIAMDFAADTLQEALTAQEQLVAAIEKAVPATVAICSY